MRQEWLGALRRLITIVLVVFSLGGIFIGKLHRVDLIGLGEEIRWLVKLPKTECGDLMHLLELADVSRNFRRVGQVRGQVFARLNII